MFPFSVLLTTCATQGASSSGLLLNARVCPLSVTLSLSTFLLTPWPDDGHHQVCSNSKPASPLLFVDHKGAGWVEQHCSWSLCDLVCVFACHPLHSERFTDMWGGGLKARSCSPFRFEGLCDCVCLCVCVCGCGCGPSGYSNTSLLSYLFSLFESDCIHTTMFLFENSFVELKWSPSSIHN